MKICLAISTLSSGGAERNACLLANFLSKKNSVSLLTFQNNKKSFYKLSKNIKIDNLNLLNQNNNFFFKIVNFVKRIYLINKYFRNSKPETIISFLETMNITVLISSLFIKKIKIKIISDRNNPQKSERPLLILIFKFLFYRFSNYLVLQTQGIKKEYNFVKDTKIKIIKNMISENIKIKKKKTLNKKLKFISVGRLEHQKGYDILLSALKLLKNDQINFKCDIYGTGSQRGEIERLINNLDLKKNVFLKGVSSEILRLYYKYDLYILSSKFEGFPNTLLEAISAGVVSISSDCDYGPSEIIKKNKNGMIFKNNDPLDLYNKISHIISDEKKYSEITNSLMNEFNFKKYNKEKFLQWKKLIKKN